MTGNNLLWMEQELLYVGRAGELKGYPFITIQTMEQQLTWRTVHGYKQALWFFAVCLMES